MYVPRGLKSVCENQDFGSLVPEGRLKVVQGGVAAYFQSSFQDQPRTPFWAKFSRPCGTQSRDGGFSRRL
jgi:hypothetical protein